MTTKATDAEIALSEQNLAIVCATLAKHAAGRWAFVFGSRVVTNAEEKARVKPHSDIDIALAGSPLTLADVFQLREAFSESDLPLRVDVVTADELPSGWERRAWAL